MAKTEMEPPPSTREKFAWWTKWSGLVIAALGVIQHWAEGVVGGATLFVAGHFLGEKKGQQSASA